jgi:flavin reductase (DIM6/NTAB) family NADH-FMN oxidoreductase RutF
MHPASSQLTPMLTLDPAEHEPRQIYKVMTGIIVPRPIALVSTIDSGGVPNVAPFSFFCGVGSVPPKLLFCPALRSTEGSRSEPAERHSAEC